jgi:ankyrin repeat protein
VSPGASAGAYEDAIAAVREDRTDEVIELVRRGLDPNTVDRAGTTLMMVAAANGNDRLLAFLLNIKANALKQDRYGDTALGLAALNGHRPTVRLFLESGVPVDVPGWSALHYAVFNGHADIVRDLIGRGANPNLRAPNRYTALMLAARNGHKEIVRLLLDAGADPGLGDLEGKTAARIAQEAGNDEIAGFLRTSLSGRR